MNGHPWLLYAIAFLATVLLGLTWYQIDRTSDFSNELRQASVESCERQNEVRRANRRSLREELNEEIPHSFFPNIPKDEFRRLIAESARATRNTIKSLELTDCEAVIPEQ